MFNFVLRKYLVVLAIFFTLLALFFSIRASGRKAEQVVEMPQVTEVIKNGKIYEIVEKY